MKSSNLQQGKRTNKGKDPFASDEEQANNDSLEILEGESSDSQVIDTRI